jgi:ribosomal protein S18 acetylase RimI-like enzyme
VTRSIEIVRLEPARYLRARLALARAFFDYELMVYAAPAARRRKAGVDAVYGAILWDSLRFGEVYVTPEVTGAACWLSPGVGEMTFPRQLRSGMLRLPFRFGLRGFRRLVAYDSTARGLHDAYARKPHWYLSAIGVEPGHQGQGIGGALMQPILKRADEQGVACYLETHHQDNVRLYQRQGFEIVEKCQLAGHPIPVWAMLRKPRSATT